jgi:hypothetical protein
MIEREVVDLGLQFGDQVIRERLLGGVQPVRVGHRHHLDLRERGFRQCWWRFGDYWCDHGSGYALGEGGTCWSRPL